jgi:hypothetical protein
MRTLVVAGVVVGVGGIALVASARDGGDGSGTGAAGFQSLSATTAPVGAEAGAVAAPAVVDAAAGPAAVDPATVDPAVDAGADSVPDDSGSVPDLAIASAPTELTPDCIIEPKSLAYDASGIDVMCLQQALTREGFYSGAVSGTFDYATAQAVEAFQVEHDLFVDGVAGRETGKKLGIWPDEQMFVVRTPPLPDGTMDSWGYPVSSVTSIGDDAPPLPENSGSGYRVVYERISQRVWAVDEDNEVIRSWLVSGSQYNNELPGTFEVYSRSEQSTAWNGRAILPLMIRWLKTDIGAIGFHGIPRHVEDGSAYQTEDELGTRLSGGCQRQADPDARFLWAFADVGTTVVVL